MSYLVLTLLGQDRPGLVRMVSEQVAALGGNWLESRMARLAGQFAGIALVDVPAEQADTLVRRLRGLAPQGLEVTIQPASGRPDPMRRTLRVEVVGQDRPGIVREMTRTLAEHDVNIEEFESRVASASFSAEQMFHASARLGVPENISDDRLRVSLERLSNELMVDITFDQRDAGRGPPTSSA